jgi:hypothetical protein
MRDVHAFELPLDRRPVRLDLTAMALLRADSGEQLGFERL